MNSVEYSTYKENKIQKTPWLKKKNHIAGPHAGPWSARLVGELPMGMQKDQTDAKCRHLTKLTCKCRLTCYKNIKNIACATPPADTCIYLLFSKLGK